MTFSPHSSEPQYINTNYFWKSYIEFKWKPLHHENSRSLWRSLCFWDILPWNQASVAQNGRSWTLKRKNHNWIWERLFSWLQFQCCWGVTQNWRTCQIWRPLWKISISQIWLAICNLAFESEHICIASSHWAICAHLGSTLKHQMLWKEEIGKVSILK